jgi:hypothetical protein
MTFRWRSVTLVAAITRVLRLHGTSGHAEADRPREREGASSCVLWTGTRGRV